MQPQPYKQKNTAQKGKSKKLTDDEEEEKIPQSEIMRFSQDETKATRNEHRDEKKKLYSKYGEQREVAEKERPKYSDKKMFEAKRREKRKSVDLIQK